MNVRVTAKWLGAFFVGNSLGIGVFLCTEKVLISQVPENLPSVGFTALAALSFYLLRAMVVAALVSGAVNWLAQGIWSTDFAHERCSGRVAARCRPSRL